MLSEVYSTVDFTFDVVISDWKTNYRKFDKICKRSYCRMCSVIIDQIVVPDVEHSHTNCMPYFRTKQVVYKNVIEKRWKPCVRNYTLTMIFCG